jgi:hypothetical protein
LRRRTLLLDDPEASGIQAGRIEPSDEVATR